MNINENISRLFVSYEISKQLKGKGFNEQCFGWYSSLPTHELRVQLTRNIDGDSYVGIENCFLAPIYQQVIDWFREKHGLHFTISFDSWNTELYCVHFNRKGNKDFHYDMESDFKTYYEALNSTIEEMLKII